MSSSAATVLLTAIGTLLAIAGVFGAYRVSRNTQVTGTYRDAAQAWEAKARAQEMEIADLQQRDKDKDTRIAELEGKVAVMQDLVTGRPLLEALATQMAENHDQLDQISNSLRALHALISPGRPQSAT